MKRLILVVGLAVLGGCRFDYFDDPALKACRASIIDTLRSPKTYDEIEANLFESSNSVFITYEAANAYGTQIRKTKKCQFIIYNNAWYLLFGQPKGSDEDHKIDSVRYLDALSKGYYKIDSNSTKLHSDFNSKSESYCLKEALKKYGEFTHVTSENDNDNDIPPTYSFSIETKELNNKTVDVFILPIYYDIARIPRNYYCSIEKDEDGIKEIISGIR